MSPTASSDDRRRRPSGAASPARTTGPGSTTAAARAAGPAPTTARPAGTDAAGDPPAIVGRGAELGLIDRALARCGRGQFGALAVDGEPGIGKTRLLDELAVRASDAGWSVWRGRATEFERDVPYALYADACAPLAGEDAVDALLAAAGGARGAGQDRRVVLRELHAALARRARPRPAVLLLDDLHWADPASVELTEYLLRRPPAVPLLIALACRRGALAPGIADALAHLGPATTRLPLDPLPVDAVAALAPAAGGYRRQLLYQASRGNPFYLQALADLPDRALAELLQDATGGEPEQALLALLRAELTGLDAGLRSVAQAAAIAGDQAPLGLVSAIAGTGEAQVVEALDRLHGIGTVVLTGVSFRFRHPLLRTAAYWSAGAGWRMDAHARAAGYLTERDGPLALLAHHTQRCARYGDEQASAILREAAASTLLTAPASAARLLRTALHVLPERADLAARRAELTMLLARAEGVSGDLQESRRLLADVIRMDGGQRAVAVAFSSVIFRLLGQLDTARALLTSQLTGAAAQARSTAQLWVELAAVEVLRADPAAARRAARRAARLLAGTDDNALASSAHALLALGHLQAGNVGEARRHSSRAGWLLDAATDPALAQHIELVAPLTWVLLQLGEYDAAARHLDRGLDVAYRNGLRHPLPYLLITDAALRLRRGRLAEAVAVATEALHASSAIRSPETAAMARVMMLCPILWRDGPAAVRQVIDELTAGGAPKSRWWAGLASVSLGAVESVAPGTVPAEAPAAPDGPADSCGVDTAVYRLALRALGAGQPADAEEHARAALRFAERSGLPHQLGSAHDAYARVLSGTGATEGAIEHARAAVESFGRAASPIEEARGRELLAQLYAVRGDTAARYTELGLAKAGYARCGAAWLSRQAARTEARLSANAPRQRRDSNGILTLTEREREIAELASEGMSTRDIAGRLHLSPKTVEAHLTRIFAKLDVHSRIALGHRLR